MITFLYVLYVMVCLFLILVVLLQAGKGGGLAESFSSAESMFGTQTNAFMVRLSTGKVVNPWLRHGGAQASVWQVNDVDPAQRVDDPQHVVGSERNARQREQLRRLQLAIGQRLPGETGTNVVFDRHDASSHVGTA